MTVRVLVLAWRADRPEPPLGGVRLAAALATAGAEVRLVARTTPTEAPAGALVRTVAEVPPVLPTDGLVPVLSTASRALAVASRWLEEQDADVVHAEGWHTVPTALGLHTAFGLPLVTATSGRVPPDADLAAARTELLEAAAAHGPVLQRPGDLPGVVPPAPRRPGPPPAAGQVRLVAPTDGDARELAAALRRAVPGRPRVGSSARRRPRLVVVADPHGTLAVLDATRLGVPVVCVDDGPAAALVREAGCGVVTGPSRLPAAAAELFRDTALAARLGAQGRAHADTNWSPALVADRWLAAATAPRSLRLATDLG